MNFHEQVGGVAPGRRSVSLSSLNKSGIVLLCAAWETYVESVSKEKAFRKIRLAQQPSDLPKPIFRLVTAHIRGDKNESVWTALAGRGWKDVAQSVVDQRIRSLNTPKPGPVRELFKAVNGVSDITDNWLWRRNDQQRVLGRLNDFVTLRGAIAHGDNLGYTVTKYHLNYGTDLILRLVECVEERLRRV